MPRGDRTGPMGQGPMTGRAAGYCAGYNVPGYMNPVGGRGFLGRGLGLGRGWGRGFGRGYYPYTGYAPYYPYPTPAPYTPENEKQDLDNQLKIMKDEMKSIEKRLEEIKTEKK